MDTLIVPDERQEIQVRVWFCAANVGEDEGAVVWYYRRSLLFAPDALEESCGDTPGATVLCVAVHTQTPSRVSCRV